MNTIILLIMQFLLIFKKWKKLGMEDELNTHFTINSGYFFLKIFIIAISFPSKKKKCIVVRYFPTTYKKKRIIGE